MKREVCLACLASLNLLLLELTVHYTEAKFNSKCLVSTTGGTMYQAFFFLHARAKPYNVSKKGLQRLCYAFWNSTLVLGVFDGTLIPTHSFIHYKLP